MVTKMKSRAKVGERGQVVIPKPIREALGIRPGDRLIVEIAAGGVLMYRQPDSYTKALRGLYKESWAGVEVAAYIEKEREEWDSRPTR